MLISMNYTHPSGEHKRPVDVINEWEERTGYVLDIEIWSGNLVFATIHSGRLTKYLFEVKNLQKILELM
jgi:hypothetical protein